MSYFIAVRFADLANDRSLFDSTLTLASQVKNEGSKIVVNQPGTALKMIAIDPYDTVYFKVSDPDHRIIAGQQELPAPPESNFLPD
ncbi:MAG TPA: sensor histidine kinase N-terminal domain-containing protein, partial [Gallionellaceae bacterium]|nr:sensor histidine kinase N-terminal domain-containing protein [Gallionellaceae bacterium]